MRAGPEVLRQCYDNVLRVAVEHGVRTVCFCCISAGGFGYPPEKAAEVALRAVREALDTRECCEALDRVVFGCYRDFDYQIYQRLLPTFFPPAADDLTVDVPVRMPSEPTQDEAKGEAACDAAAGSEARPAAHGHVLTGADGVHDAPNAGGAVAGHTPAVPRGVVAGEGAHGRSLGRGPRG